MSGPKLKVRQMDEDGGDDEVVGLMERLNDMRPFALYDEDGDLVAVLMGDKKEAHETEYKLNLPAYPSCVECPECGVEINTLEAQAL